MPMRWHGEWVGWLSVAKRDSVRLSPFDCFHLPTPLMEIIEFRGNLRTSGNEKHQESWNAVERLLCIMNHSKPEEPGNKTREHDRLTQRWPHGTSLFDQPTGSDEAGPTGSKG